MLKELIKLADFLDKKEMTEAADIVDSIIEKSANDLSPGLWESEYNEIISSIKNALEDIRVANDLGSWKEVKEHLIKNPVIEISLTPGDTPPKSLPDLSEE